MKYFNFVVLIFCLVIGLNNTSAGKNFIKTGKDPFTVIKNALHKIVLYDPS